MLPGIAVALLLSTGASSAQARLQCVNDEVIPAEAPPAGPLPAFVKRQDPKPVDVYFHIASTADHEDRITPDIVDAQFEVLRSTFSRHGFALHLADVSRVVDDVLGGGFFDEGLGVPDYGGYVAWRAATRRGGYDALNVYFFTDLSVAVGGVCSTAGPVAEGGVRFWLDGCWVNGDTMPGMPPRGTAEGEGEEPPPPAPAGHIAVHEVGHWFGLYHTFRGGDCDAANDLVDDTPAQAGGTAGCPVERDSCPDSPGLDPIHNFMDYSDDSCTSEFTPGQEERMHRMFDLYRRRQG
ncbi:metalloprotease 1 [Colletotrichum falcatum]|nr:metalloprotease 1 [Colletotrichum falcatum]